MGKSAVTPNDVLDQMAHIYYGRETVDEMSHE